MSVDFVFLDSGTGGIPYLNYLREKCTEASCVYVADNANFPYGQKTHEQIVESVLSVTKKIVEKLNPSVIVIACNTMSVNALDVLREAFSEVQFVGTVPAIKTAGEISKKRCIGLLATNSTINHPYNQDLKNHFAADCKLVCRGDPDLIAFIEHESFTASQEERLSAVRPAVDFFEKEGCDVMILGCTHFLNLTKDFEMASEGKIKVVDSKEGVVNRALSLRRVFTQNDSDNLKNPKLFITGFSDKKDEKEYDVICKRYNLEFGGIL